MMIDLEKRDNGIIQRKEKVSWRTEETARKGQKKGKNRQQGKGKSVCINRNLPSFCPRPAINLAGPNLAIGDTTGLCFMRVLSHLWPLCWHVMWYVIYHYCRVNDLPLNRNLRITNVHARQTCADSHVCSEYIHNNIYENLSAWKLMEV